jgi:predicted nucleic acid-binding protein
VARQGKIVVDASVAFKWYVVEDGTGEALRMLEDYQKGIIDIASVSLMPFEVLNALRYAPDTSIMDLQKVAKSLDKLCLDLRQLKGELSLRAVENALRYGITVYDSSYLSLGEIEAVDVYTSDEKLLGKTGDACLKPLSGYPSQ